METEKRQIFNPIDANNTVRIGQTVFVKRENWKRLFEIAKHWNYGSEHTHEEISEIIGLCYDKDNFGHSGPYYREVQKANKELQGIGRLLQVVRGEGYRVVNPNEYVKCANIKERHGIRRLKQSVGILEDTPLEFLTDVEKGIYHITRDAKRSLLVLCKQSRKDVNKLLREETRIQIRTGRN